MKIRSPFTALLFLLLSACCSIQAQPNRQRLKVFLDCHTYCDADFIRTEINIVNFLNDRQSADVHILAFSQETGGGGRQYEIMLLGQHQYAATADTIRFSTDPNSTDFERRDLLVKYLKLGLVRFMVAGGQTEDITISMKKIADSSQQAKKEEPARDPWNYWVFNTGISGYYSEDAVYQSSNINGRLSASKVTDKIKFVVEGRAGKDKSVYTFEDTAGVKEKIKVRNSYYQANQYYIHAIDEHWSAGYQVLVSRSSFSNNKNTYFLEAGVEYDIFPYKQFNTKLFTLSYILNIRYNRYFDSTIYDKIKETLAGQEINAKFTFNQKWGSIYIGAKYRAFLHNLKFFNLGANASASIRVAGGFSVFINTSAELVRDQIYLPKGGATQEEVLTRRRQLASGYNFQTNIGINYRFGSKLNNFVNPRFE